MSDPTPDDARRGEAQFARDDQALVVEVSEDPEADDVAQLVGALETVDVDDAEHRLASTTGPKPIGRLGSYRRW
jgi:hypothetical protein